MNRLLVVGATGVLTISIVLVWGAAIVRGAKPGGGGSSAGPSKPVMAFVARDRKGDHLVAASADMSSQVDLAPELRGTIGPPSWSPNGTLIAFFTIDTACAWSKLYVSDGAKLTLIRSFCESPSLAPERANSVSWSPTGREVVYANKSVGIIYVLNVLTGNVRVLMADPQRFSNSNMGDPQLSPDLDLETPGYQGQIAFEALDLSSIAEGEFQWDIVSAPIRTDEDGDLMPIESESITPLFPAPGTSERYPAWSPDGRRIACWRDQNLAVIDLVSLSAKTIATDIDGRPTWTSDGAEVASSAFRSSDIDLLIAPADGGTLSRWLTQTRGRHESYPSWSPQ